MPRGLSLALAAAVCAATIADPEPCEACQSPANAGLCHSEHCRRQVLPQAKGPSWHRDAHSGRWMETAEGIDDRRTAAELRERSLARNAALERQSIAARRAIQSMRGGAFTRTRHARAR